MDDEAQTYATRNTLQGLAPERQMIAGSRAVQPIAPADLKRLELEQEAEQARWAAEQVRERDERSRATALQLACAVCGSQGDHVAVLEAASGFLTFLNGSDQRPH